MAAGNEGLAAHDILSQLCGRLGLLIMLLRAIPFSCSDIACSFSSFLVL